METPFTTAQFFEVIRNYNLAVWPAQVILLLLAIIAVIGILGKPTGFSKPVLLLLSGYWLWMGIVYHLLFFTSINPAAIYFGAFFILQGLLLIVFLLRTTPAFDAKHGLQSVIGWSLIFYALVAYPAIGFLVGQRYPEIPTFGLPCPTTIFTFGIFCFLRGRIPIGIFVIPFLWASVAFSAALNFGVVEDFALPVSALATLTIIIAQRRHPRISYSS
jgi:hypothetical protein